ncbi:MAG: methyltransferase domain-containing protein [Balneolaceae bacterium]|nr:methyltransferase domain-containing protein [Balneolaceae bacterium]
MASAKTLLNIGCGETWHPDWVNLDLAPRHPEVRRHDLREGLPFGEGTVDACYSSHVLEHLDEEEADFFIREQRRVLRPGGVLRVAVTRPGGDLPQLPALPGKVREGRKAPAFPTATPTWNSTTRWGASRSGGRLGELWSSGRAGAGPECVRSAAARGGGRPVPGGGAEGGGRRTVAAPRAPWSAAPKSGQGGRAAAGRPRGAGVLPRGALPALRGRYTGRCTTATDWDASWSGTAWRRSRAGRRRRAPFPVFPATGWTPQRAGPASRTPSIWRGAGARQ